MNWLLVILLVVENLSAHTIPWNRQINEDNSAKVFEEEQIVEEPIDENNSNFDSEVKSFEQQQEKTGASSKHTVEKVKGVNKTCFHNACDDFEKFPSVKELMSSKNSENRIKNKTDIQESKTAEKHKTDIILVNENDSESVENEQVKVKPYNKNGITEGNQDNKKNSQIALVKKIDNYNSMFAMHDKKNCTSDACSRVRSNLKVFIKKQTQNMTKYPETKEKSNKAINHSMITNIYNHSESSIKPTAINSQLLYKNKTPSDGTTTINELLIETPSDGTTTINELLKGIEEENKVKKMVQSNCTENICKNNQISEFEKKNSQISSESLNSELHVTQGINEDFPKHNKEIKTNDKRLNIKESISNESSNMNEKERYSNESLKTNAKESYLKEMENLNGSLKNSLKERLSEIINKLTKIGKSEKEESEVQEEYDENNDLTISSSRNIDCTEACLIKLKTNKTSDSLRETSNPLRNDSKDKAEISASESDENESVPETTKGDSEEQEEIEDHKNDKINNNFQSALNKDKQNSSIETIETNSFETSGLTKSTNETTLTKATNETALLNKLLENTTKECTGIDCSMFEKNITTEIEGTNKTSQLVNSTDKNDSEDETHETSNLKSIDTNDFNNHKSIQTLVKQEREETDNILNVSNKHKFEYSLLRASKVQVPNQNRYPLATNTSSEFLAEILPKSKDRSDEAKDSNAIKKNDCTNAFCISKDVFSSKDQKERIEQKHLKEESEDQNKK